MKNFAYVNAPTVDAALDALAAHDNALIVAGGTDVMIGILNRNINDKTIVDIHAIDDLKEIVDNGDTITLGALVTLKQIENSDLLEKTQNVSGKPVMYLLILQLVTAQPLAEI